jgi:hypothetical protein
MEARIKFARVLLKGSHLKLSLTIRVLSTPVGPLFHGRVFEKLRLP